MAFFFDGTSSYMSISRIVDCVASERSECNYQQRAKRTQPRGFMRGCEGEKDLLDLGEWAPFRLGRRNPKWGGASRERGVEGPSRMVLRKKLAKISRKSHCGIHSLDDAGACTGKAIWRRVNGKHEG